MSRQRILFKRSSTIYLSDNKLADASHSLNSLAQSYEENGNYTDAETALKQVLAIREKSLGKIHLLVAQSVNNLAACLAKQGKNSEAEPLFQRALSAVQKTGDKAIIATVVDGYSKCLDSLGKKSQADKMRKGM